MEYSNEIAQALQNLCMPNGENDIEEVASQIHTFGFDEMEEFEIVDEITTQIQNF